MTIGGAHAQDHRDGKEKLQENLTKLAWLGTLARDQKEKNFSPLFAAGSSRSRFAASLRQRIGVGRRGRKAAMRDVTMLCTSQGITLVRPHVSVHDRDGSTLLSILFLLMRLLSMACGCVVDPFSFASHFYA